jgi:hypothetical protein
MGKGRTLGHAMRSRVSPPAGMRWVAPANGHARGVGAELFGKKGGGRAGVRQRFSSVSKACQKGYNR